MLSRCFALCLLPLFACELVALEPGDELDHQPTAGVFGPKSEQTIKQCVARIELPAGLEAQGGTRENSVKWLECWRQESGGQCFGRCLLCTFGEGCSLNDTFLTQISSACSEQPDSLSKIMCSGREVKRHLPTAYVCRDHAACHIKVLARLGITARLGAGFLADADGDGNNDGHAWVEIPNGATTIIADAYNDIYYTVRR